MRYPPAEWRPLPENATEPRITPRTFVFHSIVGSAEGAYGYFLNSTDLESHFIMRKNGSVIQLIDTDRQADAQFRANDWAISVETEDNGNPDKDPWTPEQLASLVDLALWASEVHGIPRREVRHWMDSGFGYHSMFTGLWSPVSKTCPGIIRRVQYREILLPAIIAGTPLTPEEAAMFVNYGDEGRQVRYWQRVILDIDPEALPEFGDDKKFGDEVDAAVKGLLGTDTGRWIGPVQAAQLHALQARANADRAIEAALQGVERRVADAVLEKVSAEVKKPTREELVGLVDQVLSQLEIVRADRE